MCGRFALSAKTKDIEKLLPGTKFDSELLPRYNIAPTQNIASVLSENTSALSFPKWGLVPFWAKDTSGASKLINTRSETITEKPTFSDSFKKRRCLILTTGFYEWKKIPGQKKAQPYFIKLLNQEVFAFAGIYSHWKAPTGTLTTTSIITTEPNELMSQIHNRMPVIISPEDFEVWLAPNADVNSHLLPLLKPFSSEEMVKWEVSLEVNNPANDSPDCCKPIEAA